MAFEHHSGLPGVYDRTPSKPEFARVLPREGNVSQAAEMMEMQSIIEGRGRRIADRSMSDGNRIDGAEIIVEIADGDPTGAVTLTAGRVYARGDVRQLPSITFPAIPATGEVVIGVRIVSSIITEIEDPDLLGLFPGSEAEGEPGAARETEMAVWGWGGDGQDGDLYQVYLLKDGTPVDQTSPSALSDVSLAIATYDRDANGSYVVRGCKVKALGNIGGSQHFSIAEGVANILGWKRTRAYSMRHVEPEGWDETTVVAEPHTFSDGGTGTAIISLNRGPLATLNTAIITKQKTVTLTKGAGGAADALPDGSVSSVVEVKQSTTVYVAGTDYSLNADRIDWSLAGAEPTPGSSYQVTYRYLSAVAPASVSSDTVTLSGGVTGSAVLLSYTYKLPRADLLCLDKDGLPVYVRGISSPAAPRAPAQPTTLLALAQIVNDWRGAPEVINTDIRSVPYDELWVYIRKLFDYGDLIALERLKSDVDSREPVAKKGIFVDPWEDDFFRDQGVAQTGAVFGGSLQLGIVPTIFGIGPVATAFLDYTEEVVLRQELATGCMLVNPYQNFNPLPLGMGLSPAVDFWTVTQTEWTSAVTRTVTSGTSGTRTELLSERSEQLPFLRSIPVEFSINGLATGETLASLTFDSLDVTPPGPLAANGSGIITGTFTIPANIPAGTKQVVATSGAGRVATGSFTGQGVLEIDVVRQVTTIRRQTEMGSGDRGGGRGGNGPDPLAQTFMLEASRFIAGVDLRVCAVGDEENDLLVEIHGVDNGVPTEEILAQATVRMVGVSPGQWITPRFAVPIWLNNDRQYALMIKTDDAEHALSIASVGAFDEAAQRFVSGQPYTVGVLLSSSNAVTWTAHQNDDLTFRLVAAKFAPVTKTVNLGSVTVALMSDLLILAGVELATAAASVVFELERADGSVTRIMANQPWALTEYVSETVIVRALLSGSETVTPILYPGVQLIAGRLMETGTYISRAFDMGAAIRMSAFLKSKLPAGSTLVVEIDKANGTWEAVTQHASTILNDGWTEREFRKTPYTATVGRLRLTISGNPAARPVLSDMRAVSI